MVSKKRQQARRDAALGSAILLPRIAAVLLRLVVDSEIIQFSTEKLSWIGAMSNSVSLIAVWHTTGVRDIAQARSRALVIGATSKGSNTYAMPALMNEFLGTRFKIVTGYEQIGEVVRVDPYYNPNYMQDRGDFAPRPAVAAA